MSVPSFIDGGFRYEACDHNLSDNSADERATLIGLQALTLNLASANQRQRSASSANQRQVSASSTNQRRSAPASTNRRALRESRLPRPTPSPKPIKRPLNRTYSTGASVERGSSEVSHRPVLTEVVFEPYCPVHHRGVTPSGGRRQFTNNTNLQVKHSESMDSLSSRGVRAGSVNSVQTANQSRTKPRQQAPTAQQNTPRSSQNTPRSNQNTPRSGQNTPRSNPNTPKSRPNGSQSRQGTPASRANSSRAGSDMGRQFADHWNVHQVQQGLQKGQLVEGVLRINPKNYKDAYISAPDGLTDIYIAGVYDRNRALQGDSVAIELYPNSEWQVLDQALLSFLHLEGSVHDLRLLFADDTSLRASLPRFECLLPCSDRFPRPLHLALGMTGADEVSKSSARMTVAQRLFAFTPEPKPQQKQQPKQSDSSRSGRPLDPSVTSTAVASDPVNVELGVSVTRACEHPGWGRFVQRKGRVVAITNRSHSRRAVGTLCQSTGTSVLFRPRDSRVPRMLVNVAAGLGGTDWNEETLFVAELTEWKAVGRAVGMLCTCLGAAGSLDVEMCALLAEYCIEDDPATTSPDADDEECGVSWSLSEEELEGRRDLRSECVFTIDPASARDLDDAVSCRRLPDSSLFQVGVHIADVSHFVQPGSAEDVRAARRTTSVYLPQRVIPMLPRWLCERACSLRAGSDRLAFSVMFTLDDEGRVQDTWFGRTVIRSCCQLAYEHAQCWIDRAGESSSSSSSSSGLTFPEIHDGWREADLVERVLVLHRMARAMRLRRDEAGAIHLDQQRVGFTLDSEGVPLGAYLHRSMDANWLIEELMLLANGSVAERLSRLVPERAVLRSHAEPGATALSAALRQLSAAGISLEADSSGALQASLSELGRGWREEYGEKETAERMHVVVNLLSRPMEPARYFRAGSSSRWRHYALSVDVYTHFTSPIRRYPDVLVHRQLAECVEGGTGGNELSVAELDRQLAMCNERREATRVCVEKCSELLVAHMVCRGGSAGGVWGALVCQVLDGSFDVLLMGLALVKRVYINRAAGLVSAQYSMERGLASWQFKWLPCETCGKQLIQRLQIFSKLSVELCSTSDSMVKFEVRLLRPDCCQTVCPIDESSNDDV